MGLADAGEQQAKVVVNLGDRADRRAGILARGFLFYGDCRREAFNGVHVRLVHLLEELARVGGQAFHVSSLAFGIDSIESERRLA